MPGYIVSCVTMQKHTQLDLPDNCTESNLHQDSFESIKPTEECSTVHDDAQDGSSKSLVQSTDAIRLVDLGNAVKEAVELPVLLGLANVSAEAGTSKVQRIDEEEGSGTSCSASRQVSKEEQPESNL